MRRWPIRDALYWATAGQASTRRQYIAPHRYLHEPAAARQDAAQTILPMPRTAAPVLPTIPAPPPYPDYSAISSRVYHTIKDSQGSHKLDAAMQHVQNFLAQSDKRQAYELTRKHAVQATILASSDLKQLDQVRTAYDIEQARSQRRITKLLSFTLGLFLQEPNSLVQASKLCDIMISRRILPSPATVTTMLQRAIARFEADSRAEKPTRDAIFSLLRHGLALVPQADLHLFSLVMATHVRYGTPTPDIMQIVQDSMSTAGFAAEESWPAEAYDAIISAFRRDGDLASCRRWYEDYRALAKAVDADAARHWPYISMLFAQQQYGRRQDSQAMMDILADMRQDGLEPPLEILNALLRQARDTCNNEAAEQIWAILGTGRRDIESYIQYLRAAPSVRTLVHEALELYKEASPKMQSRFLHTVLVNSIGNDMSLCLWALRQYEELGVVMSDETVDALGRGLIRFWLRERLERDWSYQVFGSRGLGIWQASHGDPSHARSARRRRVSPRMWAALEAQLASGVGAHLSRSLPLTRPAARYNQGPDWHINPSQPRSSSSSSPHSTPSLPTTTTSIPPSLYTMVKFCSQRNHDSGVYVKGFRKLIEGCIAADVKRRAGAAAEEDMMSLPTS